ncbi:VOC family protein [Rhodococcoides navarretei]|uniref:VOC family protein n=1 Tax=Rhodococcus navarretei TaxID=3128981 RepID=A0ABU9D1L9_9NOCA
MKIESLDHLVITALDPAATVRFHTRVLGMTEHTFGSGRTALLFGSSKINVHQAGHEFEPKADVPTPGSADLCFLVSTPIADVVEQLHAAEVAIVEGPVTRTGATGPILSVYVRDPDGNLIELSNPA